MSIRRVVVVIALSLAVGFAPGLASASPMSSTALLQSDTTTTVVNGEDDAVDELQTSFDDTGDSVDILSITALVAGLLGMLMGGVALVRTNRRD